MNHRSLLLFAVGYAFLCLVARAQNSVGIGTETPNSNAVLHLVSPDGNQGFLVPQVSTTERTASSFTDNLASDDQGLLVFDSTEQVFYYWSGSLWTSLSAQQLTAGTGLSIVGNTITNTGDLDDQNEIQDLSLSGNSLTITNNSSSTTIDLSAYLDNTDSQTLALVSSTLSISGGNSVDLSSLQDGTGTDDQTAAEVLVTASGNLVSTNVQDALSELQDDIDGISDTDDQTAAEVSVTASGNLTSTNVQDALSEIQADVDAISDTDDQTASEVVVTPTGNLTSSDVQSALAELQADIDAGSAGGDMFQSVYDSDGNSTVDDAETVNGLTVLTAVPSDALFTDSQTLSFDGSSLSLTGGGSVDLSGLSDGTGTDNQTLSLLSNTLTISGSGSNVDLSGYLDNTDAQSLSFDGSSLSLTGGGSVDLSGLSDGTGTDDQTLDLTSDILTISGSGSTVDLSGYLDNTDSQTLSFDGSNLSLTGGGSVDLSGLSDGTGTDNQTLSLLSNTLTISGSGSNVDLSGYLDNTDAQSLSFDGSSLSLTGGGSVDLSSLGDDADADASNEFQTLTYDGRSSSLSLSDGGGTVDLSDLIGDADDTNEIQDLTFSSDILGLSGSTTTFDLSGYLDNTDAQAISRTGNTLSISGNASTVDLSGYLDNTDAQNLTLSGNTLSLTGDATPVSLAGYLDNTDDQNLTFTGTTLSIEGGNSVNLSSLQGGTVSEVMTLSSADFSPVESKDAPSFAIKLVSNGQAGIFFRADVTGEVGTVATMLKLPNGASLNTITVYADQGTNAESPVNVTLYRGSLGTIGRSIISSKASSKPGEFEAVSLVEIKENINNSSNFYLLTIDGEITPDPDSVGFARIMAVTIEYTY